MAMRQGPNAVRREHCGATLSAAEFAPCHEIAALRSTIRAPVATEACVRIDEGLWLAPLQF